MNDTLTVIDTVKTIASGVTLGGIDILSILPYLGGGFGVCTVLLGYMYKDVALTWVRAKTFDRASLVKDVAFLKDELAKHTLEEKEYWKENDEAKKFVEQHMVQTDTQVNNIKLYMESSNREILSEIRNTNEKIADITVSIKELTSAFIRHLESHK